MWRSAPLSSHNTYTCDRQWNTFTINVHLTERSTFSSRSFVAAAQGASRLISPGQHSFHKHSFPYILTLFRSFVSTAIAAFYFRDFGLPFLLKVTENCVRLMPNSHCPTGRDETVLSIRIAGCELGIMPHIWYSSLRYLGKTGVTERFYLQPKRLLRKANEPMHAFIVQPQSITIHLTSNNNNNKQICIAP